MRIPLTKYGLPQVVVYPVVVVTGMVVVALVWPASLSAWGLAALEATLAAILAWALTFFRDPHRRIAPDDAVLAAPADGRVTDINRAPCEGTVETITYRKGRYVNAMNPLCGKVNESNALVMVRTNEPRDRLVVRQISGAIARRIVCAARQGQELARGEKFGMIKFGSRTELYVPADSRIECLVQVGDKVKAGVTPVARYTRCRR